MMTTLNPQDSVVANVCLTFQELELHICDLADRRNGEDDTGLVAGERQTTHRPQTPDAPPSPGPPMIPA